MKTLFLSYSWANKTVADQVDAFFSGKDVSLKRDVRDLEYKDSIKAFMKKIRDVDFCLILLSRKFVESKNCMYEVLELIKDDEYQAKVIPIVFSDIDISSSAKRAAIIEYWQSEFSSLEEQRNRLSPLNQKDIMDEMRMVENVQRNIGEFLATISDMRFVVVNNDITLNACDEILRHIDPNSDEIPTSSAPTGFFVLNIPQSLLTKVSLWWKSNSEGYTMDIRDAKIFTKDEVIEMFVTSEHNEWDNKKFAGIPMKTIIDIGTNVVPFLPQFTSKMTLRQNEIFGNKRVHLTKEEVEEYY